MTIKLKYCTMFGIPFPMLGDWKREDSYLKTNYTSSI
jgi:hypothetical protein